MLVLGAKLEIIEPCGFLLNDKRFKRVVMDYMDEKEIKFYQSSEDFFKSKKNQRIILMTTKASISYTNLNLIKMIQFYLEEKVLVFLIMFINCKNRLKIPMKNNNAFT